MARSSWTKSHLQNVVIIPSSANGDASGDTCFAIYPIDSDEVNGSPTAEFTITDTGVVTMSGGTLTFTGNQTLAGTFDVTSTSITAGGDTSIYGYALQTTAALTGDIIGVHGNARLGIGSGSGNVIGGYFQAGTGAPDSPGWAAGVVRGVYAEVVNKTPTAASVTIANARGVEVNMDLDQGTSGHTTTITTACMFYGNYNAPTSGTYTTITNGYGAYLVNEAVGGTGQMLDAALYVTDASMSGGIKGWAYGIDFSGIGAASGSFGTADIRLANGETIDNSTNGIISMVGAVNFCVAGGTMAASAGVLGGAGTSGSPATTGSTSCKGFSFYLNSSSVNTAHTLEGFYMNVDFGNGTGATAAPHGEAGRFRASLKGSPTGVCGCHNTVEWISSGATCSGATYGTYSNLVFLNSTAGGGRLSGLCAELFSGGSNTDLTGATASCLCLSIQGTVTAAKWTGPLIDIEVPTGLVGDGLLIDDTSTAATIDGKIRIMINGVEKWLLYDDGHD